MTYFYHCNICNKSVLLKSAKKRIQSQRHQYLADTYPWVETFNDINVEQVDNIYNNFVKEHNRRFEKYTIQCFLIIVQFAIG